MGFVSDWKRETVNAAAGEVSLAVKIIAFFAKHPLLAQLAGTLVSAGLIYYSSYRVLEWYGERGFQVFALALIVIAIRGRK